MSKDTELEGWRTEWQSLGGREGLADELARRVAKDGRRIRRGVAVEIGASIFGAAVIVWLVVRTRGDLVATVACAGILVFIGIWISRLVTLREGSLGTTGKGLDDFVELTRRRLADDLRWGRFGMRAMRVLTLAFIPWGNWVFVTRYANYRAEPWRGIVGFGTAALIFVFFFVWQRRKQRKLEAERDRFEALDAERTLA